jgi:release factor glutamine methyltransferase
MLSLGVVLKQAEAHLEKGAHPERARQDAEMLMRFALQRDRAWLLTHGNRGIDVDEAERLEAALKRRVAGEPIQYITGETEFHGLPIRVTRDVLIPRPETEHVVEKAIALSRGLSQPRIVDVGTGSGAIAVALAHNLPDAQITATDLSPHALAIAKKNCGRNGLGERVRFLEGDLLSPVAHEQFEFVVSNPPYVATSERDSLAVEVRDYEPSVALFAGEDGLSIYRRLIPAAHAVLVPGGFIVLEIGYNQAEAVRALLLEHGFASVEFTPDLLGISRVASAQRPATP